MSVLNAEVSSHKCTASHLTRIIYTLENIAIAKSYALAEMFSKFPHNKVTRMFRIKLHNRQL
jgi:hypothetical protein